MEQEAAPLSITIKVYRRLDNRNEGQPDDSPRALELHNIRKAALHDALSGTEEWEIDWGSVDDAKSHELVHFIVTFVSDPQVHAAAAHAASWVALEASKAAIGAVTVEAVKKLLEKIIPKQKEGKILNFWFNLPANTSVFVDREGEVTVGPTPPDWPED